jgi:hypothetical protein
MPSFKEYLTENTEPQVPTWDAFKPFADKVVKFTRQDKFANALEDLRGFLAKKEIYLVQFGEIKYPLERGLETILEHFIWRYMDEIREPAQTDINLKETSSAILYTSRNISSLGALDKRVEAALKVSKPQSLINLNHLVKISLPLKSAFDYLKPFVKKGRVPNPNAVPKFVPKFSPDTFKKLVASFQKDLEDIKQRHWANVTDFYINKVESVRSSIEGMRVRDKRFKELVTPRTFLQILVSKVQEWKADREWKADKDAGIYHIAADWKEQLKAMALRDIENNYEVFSNKNARKLSAIFEKVGEPTKAVRIEIRVSGLSLESNYHYEFAEGGSFNVYNSMEWATSSRGTDFTRYPTRFTNVKLSDGTQMSQPSEEKMVTQFK